MKSMRSSVVLAGLLVLGGMTAAIAGQNMPAPHAGSKEFERLKTLAGVWKGTGDMGKGSEDVTVEYRLTSGGSAIVETLSPGTPHEMVTMYYDKDGKPEMTHYCALGNRPRMTLKKADEKSIEFALAKGNDFDPSKEMHMHSLILNWTDGDHMTAAWTLFEGGKAKSTSSFTLTRAPNSPLQGQVSDAPAPVQKNQPSEMPKK